MGTIQNKNYPCNCYMLRNIKGFTQLELIKRAGIKYQNYIARLEGGNIAYPDRDTLKNIAKVLGLKKDTDPLTLVKKFDFEKAFKEFSLEKTNE